MNTLQKSVLLTWLLACAAGHFSFARHAIAHEPVVRVMSFNIRYGTAKDGDNHWDRRKDFLVQTIREYEPDLLGTQETLDFQRDYIAAQIDDLETFGAGRDDGKDAGEMAALAFRKDRFEKIDGGHFWLSDQPEVVGSKGWDAALPRIATWVKLRDKKNNAGLPILFLNTHFDHRGAVARNESAKLVRARLKDLGNGCRIVLTGDFNAAANSDPYKSIFGSEAPLDAPLLKDTFLASTTENGKESGTFSNFLPSNVAGPRIDWIGCSNDWDVRQANILRWERDGRTPSDHFPVTAVLGTRDTHGSVVLRILSYNIHHAEGSDQRVDLLRIARIIRDSDPDLVALQEVDNQTKRSAGIDQLSELKRLTGMHGVFGKAIAFEGGEYGQAILSRTPIVQQQVHALPSGAREQRIAFETSTQLKGRDLRFVSTHLDHQKEEFRIQQAATINELLSRNSIPTFLAGDFNAVEGSDTIAKLREVWTFPKHAPMFTIPTRSPSRQIDFIVLHRDTNWDHVTTQVLDEPVASDHLPILSIFRAATKP
jgi:endonuclease/exonuclease/phosphatase family metal-dependent hydrolase